MEKDASATKRQDGLKHESNVSRACAVSNGPCKSTLRHSPLKLGSYLKGSEPGQIRAMAVASGTQRDEEFSCM